MPASLPLVGTQEILSQPPTLKLGIVACPNRANTRLARQTIYEPGSSILHPATGTTWRAHR